MNPAQNTNSMLQRARSLLSTRQARIVYLALAALALSVGAWRVWVGRPIEIYTAARGDLVQSVVASGQMITPQRASIGAETTARVTRVLVDEGAQVVRGQPLLNLDSSDEEAAVAQARAALAQDDAKLRQIAVVALPAAREALRQAEANLTQAQSAFARTQDLVARNFLSRAQLDDAKRNLDVAASQLKAAKLQVETNAPGGADAVLAQAARAQAQAALNVAQTKLDATIVRAPADGVLIGRSVEPGDVAQAGKELMVLAPAGETQIVVSIDEKNLGKLAPGQRAIVSADAYPAQSFPAELFYVNPGIDPVRGSVEVKLRVSHPPAYLRQDMSVSVDIEVGRRHDVLVVPTNALHDSTGPQPWVLVVRKGRAVKQPVVLGMRGDSAVEVLQGIAVGDAIVPATNGLVTSGKRVRTAGLAAP
jgi:HlyD family secretion protein